MATSFIHDDPYLSKERVIDLLLSDLIICRLCENVLWLPVACQTCETAFCTSCIKTWKIETPEPTRCPTDCSEYIQRNCPSTINYILRKLQIFCRYESNGCTEILSYNRLETHEEVCDYRLRTCSGCQEKFIKKNFKEHYNQCPMVSLTCSQCDTVYQRHDEDEHTEIRCLRIQLHQLRDRMIKIEQIQNDKINQMES